MEWLRRHAWQLLFSMTALIAFIGLNPVKAGYPRGLRASRSLLPG